MFAIAARRHGLPRAHASRPDYDTPTGQVADLEVDAAYDDLDAVRALRPRRRRRHLRVRERRRRRRRRRRRASRRCGPAAHVLHITQHRCARRRSCSCRASRSRRSRRCESLERAGQRRWTRVGLPGVLKTAGFGYDGKGQARIDRRRTTPSAAWAAGRPPDGRARSVRGLRAARSRWSRRAALDGAFAALRRHREHATAITSSTCRWRRRACRRRAVARGGRDRARRSCEELDVVGVLCVEFFLTARRQGCWSTSSRRGRTTPAT